MHVRCKTFKKSFLKQTIERTMRHCYALTCSANDAYQFYYWLIYGLWQGKMFVPYLRGSVVIFIIKNELLKVVKRQNASLAAVRIYLETIRKVNVYEAAATNLLYQAQLLQIAKQVMLRQLLK